MNDMCVAELLGVITPAVVPVARKNREKQRMKPSTGAIDNNPAKLLYGIVIDKRTDVDCNAPQLGNQQSCGVEQSGSSQGS